MEQLRGLWRDTKWVWAFFVGFIAIMAISVSWFFLLTLAGLPVSFCYFAFIRYDEHGNEKADF
ncbi:hypothetical protein [Rhodopirellula sp. P2]|jgi:hypothetical protein|uniref:hypothetical protein n=1 Tax=Rhodopirellula sp. P2 TaxID=2127060 RepID=UPI0023674C7E|nr:hypothetical protein [Rhodopirellula sp. P2]WDQ15692.1 hypothetical protein PSR62_18865 [Rhodopirellula sp. P2]|tara:strand:- start:114 stop:302 length:189 start_codon:yes stop_codon:yes gene_type:complete